MKSAIIGLGGISNVHSKVLLEQGHQIVAVCDNDKSRLEKFPLSKQYTDYLQMIEQTEIDVVHICTPHYLHAQMIIDCLSRGINVLCEKPLCISLEDGEKIVSVAKASKAKFGVVHQNRYNPASVFVKDYLKKNPPLTGIAFVAWNRDKSYYDADAWRGKQKTEGGGVLINQALHTLDLLQWYLGMPSEVSAISTSLKLKEVIEVEDTVCATFSKGSEFQFFATNCAITDFPIEITIKTENDIIRLYPDSVNLNGNPVDLTQVEAKCNSRRAYGKKCYGSGHSALFADFYDCVKTGRKFSIDAEEGLKVIKLIRAVYDSKGEKIEIK